MDAKGLERIVVIVKGEDVLMCLEPLCDDLSVALRLARHHYDGAVALDGWRGGSKAVHGICAGLAVGVRKDETCVVAVVEF